MTEPNTNAAPDADAAGGDLVATVRQVVREVLGDLFSSGNGDVQDDGEKAPPADTAKPLTAAEVQRLAREEMSRAQAELKARRAAVKGKEPEAAKPTPPPAPAARGAWEKFQHSLWGEKDQ